MADRDKNEPTQPPGWPEGIPFPTREEVAAAVAQMELELQEAAENREREQRRANAELAKEGFFDTPLI